MNRTDIPSGTLTLMVLRTLDQMGPQHGWGIARRIEQVSGDRLQLNQGTIYPALLQLEQNGWIKGSWGVSDNNRRARFYAITRTGKRRLAAEEDRWRVASETILKFLAPDSGRGAS
jgi:transcriptional regulator